MDKGSPKDNGDDLTLDEIYEFSTNFGDPSPAEKKLNDLQKLLQPNKPKTKAKKKNKQLYKKLVKIKDKQSIKYNVIWDYDAKTIVEDKAAVFNSTSTSPFDIHKSYAHLFTVPQLAGRSPSYIQNEIVICIAYSYNVNLFTVQEKDKIVKKLIKINNMVTYDCAEAIYGHRLAMYTDAQAVQHVYFQIIVNTKNLIYLTDKFRVFKHKKSFKNTNKYVSLSVKTGEGVPWVFLAESKISKNKAHPKVPPKAPNNSKSKPLLVLDYKRLSQRVLK